MGHVVNRLGALALLAAALAVVASTAALAAEVTRDSYREAVEPICRVNTEANERILKGVRTEVRAGKLRPAARQFDRAAVALEKTLAKLRRVPRPAADQERLAKWLGFGKQEARLFAGTAKDLRAGSKAGAIRLVVKLQHTAILANNAAAVFEFDYCRFEPSRFT